MQRQEIVNPVLDNMNIRVSSGKHHHPTVLVTKYNSISNKFTVNSVVHYQLLATKPTLYFNVSFYSFY